LLRNIGIGEVSGGGTLIDEQGEPLLCDIEIILLDENNETKLLNIIEEFGVPKKSKLIVNENEMSLGSLEGMAIYLNGTDLSIETYENSDINKVIIRINQSIKETGEYYSFWTGPTETALYFYGKSFNAMKDAVSEFIKKEPLCEKCRIVQIA